MKTTRVTIKKTKHEKQPYIITIDPHGKAEPYKMKQRYCTKGTARRGVLRHLNALSYIQNGRPCFPVGRNYFTEGGAIIQITYK